MYKLSVYIYLNHVPFDARQKSYEFKSLVKFGSFQKKFKIPRLGLFLENHSKSNFSIRIPLYANLGFHKKMLFSQICSNGHMRAKWVPRASERASRASEPGAVIAIQANQANQKWSLYTKQTNQANQAWSERAKRASRVSDSSAIFANQAKRSLRRSSKPSKLSIV